MTPLALITDRIGRHEVLLLINHNYNKIYYIIGFYNLKNTRMIRRVFLLAVKKGHLKSRVRLRVLSHYGQSDLRISYSYDYM